MRDLHSARSGVSRHLGTPFCRGLSEQLRDAFENHQAETEQHVANLEKVFELLDMRARGVTCEAIDGILEEGKEIMTEAEQPDTRDAGMIAAAQAVEHYEITRYGTLIAWANQLGKADVIPLLQANLEQEYAADRKLTDLAQKGLNREAA